MDFVPGGLAFIIDLFYGYVFVKTSSLLPSIIIHYLSNVFLSLLSGYMEVRAYIEIQAFYGVILYRRCPNDSDDFMGKILLVKVDAR